MIKKLTAILLCALLLFTACAPATGGETYATVTDHAQREVTLSAQPQKIISAYYISSSIVIALGLEQQLVGIENKAQDRNIYALAAPHLLELEGVGTSKDFNIELAVSLEPDLVILPLKLADVADTLTDMGIPSVCVNPENAQLLTQSIDMIATLTGTQERAEQLKEHIANDSEVLAQALEGASAPSVYLGGNSDLLSTAGANMYQNTLITQAGGANVAAEIEDTYWASISYEQLIAYNPDYIVIAPAAAYTVQDVLSDSALAELDAVKNGNVLAMPSSLEAWDSPLPSSHLGSAWLASALHPELYSQQQFIDTTAVFYNDFYEFEVDTVALVG